MGGGLGVEAASVGEITGLDELELLKPEWNELFNRCPSATPFQSPEWLLPWWKHFGNDGLWVLVLRRDGVLSGLAPLFVIRRPEDGLRQVSFIGSGISDYLDFLLEPGIGTEGASMFFDYLLDWNSRWDLCDLQEIRLGAPLLDAARLRVSRAELSEMGKCPVLVLPENVKTFRAGLSARFRKRIRYGMNAFGRAGGLQIQKATGDTLAGFLEVLFDLHQTAWKERNERGMLANPEIRAFHREVAAGFLKKDWLRLRVLTLSGEDIAVLYSFAALGRLYCYLSGFDPGFSRFSPGKFVLWTAIEESIDEGLKEVDFLRGSEEYKYIWGPEDRPNFRLLVRHSI